jgi:anti-sigma factor RsiW
MTTGNGMTGQPDQWSEDLLSAYADGEVTPEQRALVEARLAQSPSLRAVLEEIEAARDAVRALPMRDAPPEFWARFLDGTGLDADDVLVPDSVADADAALPAPVVELESRRGNRLTRWVAVAGGAAAAAVVAAIVLVPSPKRVDPPVASFTDAHAVRDSLNSDAVTSLAPLALQPGFGR